MKLRTLTSSALAAAALSVGALAVPASAGQPLAAKNQPQLHGTEYSLQNYFSFAGDLTPFFDSYGGRIGPKVEIADDYIYHIDFQRTSITMTWNTDPANDIYEPHVGSAAGLTQAEAAALPIADEYWITFSKPIGDLDFVADDSMPLVPNIRIIDDYSIAISVPGGTPIGDGFDAVINIER